MAREDYLVWLKQEILDCKHMDSLSRDGSATTLMALVSREVLTITDTKDTSDPFWKGVEAALQSTIRLNWKILVTPLDPAAKSQRLHQHLTRRLAKLKSLL